MPLNSAQHLLPIEEALPALRTALAGTGTVVLQAPPGAGKTTRVPLALLDEAWLGGKTIVMLEPRRLAARSAAVFMARGCGEEVGGTVGYRIRFDNRVSARTRIEVMTEGVLTRRLQSDPELQGVGLVIFDEFHERSLQSDLGLVLCRDSQNALRDDLRILIMSATLDGDALARRFGAPLVRSEGRSFPVDIRYLPDSGPSRLPDSVSRAVIQALREEGGDILVFLPGASAIRQTLAQLEPQPACKGVMLHGLYGEMGMEAQQAAITPDPNGLRKVVLATNIAETSLTIEGVRVVIDSGWQRVPRFDPATALGRLETVRVAQASATQRCGRAGRLGPGVCYRLWGESVQQGLVPYNQPEILVSDLAPLALELALWGVREVNDLEWIDPPPAAHLQQARDLLQSLEALDAEGRITATGRAMSEWPLHPRLAHMLLRAAEIRFGGEACDVAALLSERDIMRLAGDERRCDFSQGVAALHRLRRGGKGAARELGADALASSAVERVAGQLRRQLKVDAPANLPSDETIGLLLALAYPDRIARRRQGRDERYLLANGRGAMMQTGCALQGQEWLVISELDSSGDEDRIRRAATFDPELFGRYFAPQLEAREVVAWDSRSSSIRCEMVVGFGALVLKSRPLDAAPERLVRAMLDGIRQMGIAVLPWNENAVNIRQRVQFLRHWQPEQEWPDLSDKTLLDSVEDWLAPYLSGMTRRDHLARLDMTAILRGMLDWERQQRLDEGAPTHLTVPSGNSRRIDYSDPEAPFLAVKLQELFGLAETPMLAWGRVPLTLHLLSPAQRPIQVTRDLRGFWERTYAEVKKELKGRYPKHPWPDDPWSAQATAGVKRRQ